MLASIVIIVFLAFLTAIRLYKFCVFRPPNFPPGPPRLPFFGSYLFILLINHKFKHLAIEWLCKYYKSSVIGFYIGKYPTIYANDPKSVREVLFRPEFDGRPTVELARVREPNFNLLGIFFIQGEYWHSQRRYSLRNLRDFGFGRRFPEYEAEVADEMKNFVNLVKEGPKYEHEKKYFKSDGSICLPYALIGSMGNAYLKVVANERLPRSEQYKIFNAGEGSMTFQRIANEYGTIFSIIPWIRHLFPETSSYRTCRESAMKMSSFMNEIIGRQIETYQEGHVRSFMDLYIEKMKQEPTEFIYDQMLMICTDFLFPSLSAMQIQVSFLLRILVNNQKIMRTIQDEIESVVGSGRMVQLDDRPSLPYTEACLREVLRFETLVPTFVHTAMEDTKLCGYDVPKEALVFPGLWSLHFDKETWGDPQNFRPERFLENGKLSLRADKSLPFGGGRRLCAGETFARNTMFLCLTAILQNFNLKASSDKMPCLSETKCGLTRTPNDFWLKLETK